VRLGRRPGHIVRINRPGVATQNGLAAMIPTELLVPQVSTQGGPVGMNSRISTRGGTVIGENVVLTGDPEKSGDNLSVEIKSERYAINATLSIPQAILIARQNDLRAFGAIMTGVLALLTFAFALMLPKRQRDNPITVIETALKAGEFVPYYQPVVDIRTGQLRGAEALMRWRKPDGSIILPGVFIPLAETSGLILDLTRSIMRQASNELGPVFARRPHLKVGFNMVARHFADEDVVHDVNEIFKNSQLRLSQIVLEMTERQPIESLTDTRRVIAALQGLGVQVALDDVGTGHSGLSYMLKLGVDIIKIDKMFVDSIGIDRNSTAIVETLIDLADNMRMEIIAEGVENFEQVIHLRNLGIRLAQGYVFAPPLPSSSFLKLVEAIDPLTKKSTEGQTPADQSNLLSRAQVA
jgi:sensor c-di-GMP phosphodiesterase-like protein